MEKTAGGELSLASAVSSSVSVSLSSPLSSSNVAAAAAAVSALVEQGEAHLSRGEAFSALDSGMEAVKLATAAIAAAEEGERVEEGEGEEKERNGLVKKNGDDDDNSVFFIPLSRPWRLVAEAQSRLRRHWASAAAWRQAARAAADEIGEGEDRISTAEARAAAEDAAAAADTAARYG